LAECGQHRAGRQPLLIRWILLRIGLWQLHRQVSDALPTLRVYRISAGSNARESHRQCRKAQGRSNRRTKHQRSSSRAYQRVNRTAGGASRHYPLVRRFLLLEGLSYGDTRGAIGRALEFFDRGSFRDRLAVPMIASPYNQPQCPMWLVLHGLWRASNGMFRIPNYALRLERLTSAPPTCHRALNPL
jgi:hypothetical protein